MTVKLFLAKNYINLYLSPQWR